MMFLCPFLHCKALRTAMYKRYINSIIIIIIITPLYKPYRYVPPLRVGFLRRVGLKTGIDFAPFGLESGMVYERNMVVYQCVRRFNSK